MIWVKKKLNAFISFMERRGKECREKDGKEERGGKREGGILYSNMIWFSKKKWIRLWIWISNKKPDLEKLMTSCFEINRLIFVCKYPIKLFQITIEWNFFIFDKILCIENIWIIYLSLLHLCLSLSKKINLLKEGKEDNEGNKMIQIQFVG